MWFDKNIAFQKGILPIEFVSKKTDEDCPHIDKILRICCALCNNIMCGREG